MKTRYLMNASIDTWDNQLVSVKGYGTVMFDRLVAFNYLESNCCMIVYNHIKKLNSCNVCFSNKNHRFMKVK